MTDTASADPAVIAAYPAGAYHRARGTVRHLAGVLACNAAIPALRISLERDAGQRARRLRAEAADRLEQRRRPTRKRMRALVARPGARFAWHDVPAPPPPGPGAAIVHPIAVATCDLDRAMGLGRTPFPLPMCFGHECVAEVIETGDDVRTVRPGDRVVVPFQINCGDCRACRAGLTANCTGVPPISMYGFGLAGGHWGGALADLLAVPYADAMLVPLPGGVDPAAAASVADNVSDGYRNVAAHLPALLERDPGMPVLILGELGHRLPLSSSVPLYAGLVAKALGAQKIHFADRRPHLQRHAGELGFHPHATVRGLPPAPFVIDGTCTSRGLATALHHTAPDGVCTTPGVLRRTARIPTALMYGRNISYHLGRTHARAVIPHVLGLMRQGELHPETVTTHHAKLDDAPAAIHDHVVGEATKTVLTE
ncbi:alcohol dehydrogenase catalytic domain-containing protein [Amycolatopsis sp. K13G38]|uniref:Alcohol dehydrogenase catalytic domain-containing protein n=1 Tax=Amycolatopsis acididurans TaxID=2724524 RepID=A0ABX1J4G1_9PSEU|nr:alcohol dehydrogenase catalytic domain-containing protein [Amycolatopsis acididurans]NKQ54681.1 alcohol dehydrogenase catalytic domain-containing protein [Amycolatopsis acididurans]